MSDERDLKAKETEEPGLESDDVEAHVKARQANETDSDDDVEAHVKGARNA